MTLSSTVCNNDFEVVVITNRSELESLRPEWLVLWAAGEHQIFSHPDWIASVLDAYGDDRELRVVTVRQDDELVGLLPACILDGELCSAGFPRADATELLCHASHGPMAMQCCLNALTDDTDWKTGCLDVVPYNSVLLESVESLADASRQPGRPLLVYRGEAPYVLLHGDREELVRKLAWKKTPRRRRNQLKKEGDLQFSRLETIDEMKAALPRFTELHRLRRTDAGDESYLADNRGQRYGTSLIERLGPEGLFQMHALKLDGEIIAGCIGYEAHSRYYYYTPVFDMKWSHLGVGSVLLSYLLEDAILRGVDVFDFGQGDEGYKSRFADSSVRLYALHVFGQGMVSGVRRSKLALKEQLRQHPAVYESLRRLKRLTSFPRPASSHLAPQP